MSADEGGETASMPVTNGELHPTTPDPPVLSTPGKRKRLSSHDEKSADEASSSAQDKEKLDETLRNLVDILSKSDTELQLLSCPLSSSLTKPRSKRAKTSGGGEENTSIESRVEQGRYNTLQEFLSDIEKASAAVIERNKPQTNGESSDGPPLTETVNRIAAFKKHLNTLVRQAHVTQPTAKAEATEDDSDAPARAPSSDVDIRNENLVLTLFGNPSNPKQLYSSLQKSVRVPLSSEEPEEQKYVEVQAPLREIGLPNGITATKVAQHSLESEPKEAKRTFGEVFAPRAALPQLELPRRGRTSSRTALNVWTDPFEAITNIRAFPGERNNYSLAPLPSGQWLQYGGVTSSPSFWNRRQKHQFSQNHEERYLEDPSLWADEDPSLLQGVYSSFAPSFDSTGAIMQSDAKDLVWWSKRGEKRVHTLLSVPYQEESDGTMNSQPGNIGDLDENALEEMVKTFNPEDFADNVTYTDASSKKEEETKEDKEMDDLLLDMSELLETLSSYHRIRSLEPPTSGNQGADSKEAAADLGSTDNPSTAEMEVYETLKSSLTAVVMTLPPYAVAKLNGDQLADLNISQKILVENPEYHGTLEKDDFTMQQERAAAMAPAAGGAGRASISRSGNYPAGYNQRAYATNARIQQAAGGFQTPQGYYGGRQPSIPGPFTPGHAQQYSGAPRPPASPSQRPGYPAYSQHTPQYPQGNPLQQFQRPPGQNGYNPYAAQQTPAPAQASPQAYTPRPGYNVPYGQGQRGSPQKQPQYATPQARAQYMTPGSVNPQQRYVPQQQPQQQQPPQQHQQQQPGQYPPNYQANQGRPPSAGYSNSAAAMTYARSAAEQAALMDRNKAQLAAQSRQSSTPQPAPQPAAEQAVPQDRSVTPGSKQNGTPVPS